MPKLRPESKAARREHILDAAERCFAKAGFHRTTMQDICASANVSPGALYVYFGSKEALIEGLCERDRTEFAAQFAHLERAPDFLAALSAIAQHYFVDRPPHKLLFVVEMGIEATRNPKVAEIHGNVDRYCRGCFESLFRRLQAEGRIAPRHGIPTLVSLFNVMGDGMFWRRAVHPDIDTDQILPAMTELLGWLINPVEPALPYAQTAIAPDAEVTT